MKNVSFSAQDIQAFDKRYKVQFVNSLSGIKSANLIGTKSSTGLPNLSIVSSLIHLGSDPSLLGFIQRPATVERHSFENILETKFYTVNHINQSIYSAAHQTSARYEREVSEFEATGLDEEYLESFHAPFVKQSNVKIAMKLEDVIDIEINNTKMVIGSIQQVILPENSLSDDGFLNLAELEAVGITGLDCYNKVEVIDRLSYAKPNQKLTSIL